MPENDGFPCAIDGLWLVRCWRIDANLMSAGNCARGLETAHIPRSKQRCTGKDHDIPFHTRRRVDEILATVCSCIKI